MLTTSAHDEKLASRGKNDQTGQIFVSRPREAKFSPKFCRTHADYAEQTVSRGRAQLFTSSERRPLNVPEPLDSAKFISQTLQQHIPRRCKIWQCQCVNKLHVNSMNLSFWML